MSRNKKLAVTLVVMACALMLLIAVLLYPGKEVEKPALPPKPQKVTFTIKAVGDNLIHSPIYNSCKTEDGYNFDGLYENITPYIEDADIAAINQETIFVDETQAFSGYPAFGTPEQVGDSIVNAGFNLVTHATNHTYDRGYDALVYTMRYWRSKKDRVTVIGINETVEESQNVKVFKKGDLEVATLNFTYGLNGVVSLGDRAHMINILSREEKDAELLKKAEEKADITVVFLHFGTEYTPVPTAEQKRDVEFLVQNGADIIIGTHPHVIQPVSKYTSENGNQAVVFYSLGNFVSNQSGTDKILGGMASLTIAKENGVTTVENYEILPTVTHAEVGKYTVYMLSDYTDELAKKHRRTPALTVEKIQALFDKVMATEVK